MTVAGQQDPPGGQPRAVTPHGVLEKRCPGLRLAYVKINARAAGISRPALPGDWNPARRIASRYPFRANIRIGRESADRRRGHVAIDWIQRFCRDFRPDSKSFRRHIPRIDKTWPALDVIQAVPWRPRLKARPARYVWAKIPGLSLLAGSGPYYGSVTPRQDSPPGRCGSHPARVTTAAERGAMIPRGDPPRVRR
jgi:hypothetical protein